MSFCVRTRTAMRRARRVRYVQIAESGSIWARIYWSLRKACLDHEGRFHCRSRWHFVQIRAQATISTAFQMKTLISSHQESREDCHRITGKPSQVLSSIPGMTWPLALIGQFARVFFHRQRFGVLYSPQSRLFVISSLTWLCLRGHEWMHLLGLMIATLTQHGLQSDRLRLSHESRCPTARLCW